MPRLGEKIALVTGAARGIGEAIARAFVAEGARVILTDINDDQGRETAEAIGTAASYDRLDVREESDWRRVVEAVCARHEHLDVLVNNAGITGVGLGEQDPEHADLERWRGVHATNIDGVFLGCKHAIGAMRARTIGPENAGSPRTASIINIGSRSGVVGIPRAAAYASSKAAVRNHTKTVALYCAEEGLPIRCNVIQPAAVLTPMWDEVLGSGPGREKRLGEFAKGAPLKRFGTPEEVAALAVYLASDESAYCTGGEFTIDGGMLAGTAVPPAPSREEPGSES